MDIWQLELFEQWRPAVGYEGSYIVSDWGRIMRLPDTRITGGLISQYKEKHGYLRVNLSKNKKNRGRLVHVLVAEAFLGQCPLDKEIDHIDGNRAHNHVKNLRYITHLENMQHSVSLGFQPVGEKHPGSKIKDSDLPEVHRLFTEGMSRTRIGKIFNVSARVITSILNGERKKSR